MKKEPLDLLAFCFGSDGYVHDHGETWTWSIETFWRGVMSRLYALCRLPIFHHDGSVERFPDLRTFWPVHPRVFARLRGNGVVDRGDLLGTARDLAAAGYRLDAQGIAFLNATSGYAARLSPDAEEATLMQGSRRDGPFSEVLRPVMRELVRAEQATWKACALCAAPFPAQRRDLTCDYCQDTLTRDERRRRLDRRRRPDGTLEDPIVWRELATARAGCFFFMPELANDILTAHPAVRRWITSERVCTLHRAIMSH